jgi:hypothetical protein
MGIEADTPPTSAAKGAIRGRKPGRGARVAKPALRARVAASGDRKESKQDAVIALLRLANGASIDEMMEATGWQAHSVRGFMSGALKKRLGLELVSEKDKAIGERRYYVAAIK